MGKVIERLCRCDADRANHLARVLKVWLVYLGVLCLGGLIIGTPLYIWFDRTLTTIKTSHQEEVARLITVNKGLLAIIEQRLPLLVDKTGSAVQRADSAVQAAQEAISKAESAAKVASGAATGARSAVKEAKGAATTARAAASTAKEAAADLDAALSPPAAPVTVPDYLDGP